MISLTVGQIIQATTTQNVVYTITGRDISGALDNPKILAQGFLAAAKTLFTPTGDILITSIAFRNVSGAFTELTVNLGTTGTNGQIYKASLEAGYSVSYADKWIVYDEDGIAIGSELGSNPKITVSATAPSNPSMGDLWVQL